MSKSDDDSSANSSHSSPKARSLDHLTRVQPTRMTTLSVLFIGETNLGDRSIIDLIADSGEQKSTFRTARHCAPDDVRSVTLNGKTFLLHGVSNSSESVSTVALREGVQNTLMNLHSSGGVQLLVYCMNASNSTSWVHEIHRTVASDSQSSLAGIPAVAVVAGLSDVVQQNHWWSSKEDAWTKQGPRFDGHTFIRMGVQSSPRDHLAESCLVLRELILQNCFHASNSETNSHFQYQQRSLTNSFQSLFHMIAGKSHSHIPPNSKPIDVMLLGEIGVGKSSLVNLIVREEVARVSPDSIGCTRTVDMYMFEEKGRTFHLYDTPGLVDPLMGAKAFADPIDTIQKKIRSLGNGNGPDLLLFCIDNSKPTVALQRNYRLFSNIICRRRIPFALAILKLEEGQDADQWWHQHKATIQGYGIDCSGHFGFGREKKYLDRDQERSRASLLSFCITGGQRKKKTGSLRFSMGRTVDSLTNLSRPPVTTLERTLMNQCELEEQTARELASRLVASDQSHWK